MSASSQTGGEGAPRWPVVLATLAAALAATMFLYRETVVSMAEIWLRSDTFAHGWIVLPVTLYLVWLRRAALVASPPHPTPAGLLVLAATIVVWMLASVADVLVVQQLALVAMCQSLVLTFLGWRCLYSIAFPLAFLVFAVPFGEGLIPPLMEFTARFTVRALELTGIPVFRDGLHISVPSGDFEVARACSGIRYLIASVALGSLFAYLTYHSWRRRAIFMLLSVLVPLLANGLRAYMIIMIAHLSGMRLAVGVDHLIYGWLFFGVVMFFLFWIGMVFRDSMEDAGPGISPRPDAGGSRRSASLPLGAAALVLLIAGPSVTSWLQQEVVPVGVGPAPPAAVAPWQGPYPDRGSWRPVFAGATAQYSYVYRLDDQELRVYAAWYAQQRQGAELVNSGNRVYDGTRWLMQDRGRVSVRLRAGETGIRSTRIYRGGRNALVWHWYQIGEYATGSDVLVKLVEAWQRLTGSYRGSAAIAIETESRGEDSLPSERIQNFLVQHEDALVECLFGGGVACAR